MSREDAEALVADLVYAAQQYERNDDRYNRQELLEMKQKTIDALTSSALSSQLLGTEK